MSADICASPDPSPSVVVVVDVDVDVDDAVDDTRVVGARVDGGDDCESFISASTRRSGGPGRGLKGVERIRIV